MSDLDLDHLLRMTGQDVDLADEIVGIFESQVETWGRLLNPDLQQQEWADAAHTIKGAAQSIGALELAERCQTVEAAGRGDDTVSRVHAATLLSELKTALGETLEACARARHDLSKPGLRASKDLYS